jgi:hypothetical protein
MPMHLSEFTVHFKTWDQLMFFSVNILDQIFSSNLFIKIGLRSKVLVYEISIQDSAGVI